jgi:hypothetical protein
MNRPTVLTSITNDSRVTIHNLIENYEEEDDSHYKHKTYTFPSDCCRVLIEWTRVLEARGTIPGEFESSLALLL